MNCHGRQERQFFSLTFVSPQLFNGLLERENEAQCLSYNYYSRLVYVEEDVHICSEC